MATLTIRLSDEKHERLRQLAERRQISMNKLIDELSTVALTELMPRRASVPELLSDRRRRA
jgi:predicted transcriptional regulator